LIGRPISDRSIDAATLFREGPPVPGAGVLLALPRPIESGLFRISRKLYGDIGPAFYDLRTTLLTLLLMALLRIKRPEHFKEKDPAAFGRSLRLDRAPEVKTLRRPLTRLAAQHCAEQPGRGAIWPCLPSSDYWINDSSGDPLLVITGGVEAAPKAMSRLLRDLHEVVGERKVLDRGGRSPKLFVAMIKDGFDLLTYARALAARINKRRFVRRRATFDGRFVDYLLHDHPVRFLKAACACGRSRACRLPGRTGGSNAHHPQSRAPRFRQGDPCGSR
jgi:hypothetical protein